MKREVYLGILRPGSILDTGEIRLFLSKAKVEDKTPEDDPLVIPPENFEQTALVTGLRRGSILYEALVLEVIPPLTGSLVRGLLAQGKITPDDLQNLLSQGLTPKPKKLCALVIGHKKSSPGAVNPRTGLSEFVFNDDLSRRIEEKVQGVEVQRVYRRTYQELPEDINALGPDFIVSLHCNAFNGKASGTEVLYYHRSSKGRTIAEVLLRHLVNYLGLPNRGLKPCTAEDRGGYLLRYTKAPCVIAEPFFIDNDRDLARAQEDLDGLASAYARAIEEMAQIV